MNTHSPYRSHAVATVLAALCAFSCAPEFKPPPTARISCGTDAPCPTGWTCSAAGRCLPENRSDRDPAQFSADPKVAPSSVAKDVEAVITLRVTEALAEPPEVVLGTAQAPVLPCAAATEPLSWECRYTATGTEAGGVGGTVFFQVVLRDTGGNETVLARAGSILFDFTGPALVPGSESLFLTPAEGPLQVVSAARAGTKVRVSFAFSEGVRDPPKLAALGVTGLAFEHVSRAGSLHVFEGTVAADAGPDGPVTLVAEAVDEAGNRAADITLAPASALVLDTKPPSPPDVETPGMVVHTREPWGSAALGPRPHFTIRGLKDAVEPHTIVLAYTDATGSSELGRATADADGAFGPATLVPSDFPEVFVSTVDGAGHVSERVRVRDGEWLAAFGTGTSAPHQAFVTPSAPVAREPTAPGTREVLLSERARLSAGDGEGVEIAGGPDWQPIPASDVRPSGRRYSSLAFDPVRGRTVLFGGEGAGSTPGNPPILDDTWEWDGRRWQQVVAEGTIPPAREKHRLVFDGERGHVVLFGGTDTRKRFADLWEWDGRRWRQIPAVGAKPAPRHSPAMAFDDRHGRLLLHGGDSDAVSSPKDTWTFSGNRWSPMGLPAATDVLQIGLEPADGRVVGLAANGTWQFSNAEWRRLPAAADFSFPPDAPLFPDLVHNRLLAFANAETWAFSAGRWSSIGSGMPTALLEMNPVTWDPQRERAVRFGGSELQSVRQVLDGTWEWGPAGWSDVSPTLAAPSQRVNFMLAAPPGGGVVLFGGARDVASTGDLNDTWRLVAHRWTEVVVTGTPPGRRELGGFVHDDAHAKFLLFGGARFEGTQTEFYGDTWTLDGNAWTRVSPATSPIARVGHGMASAQSKGRVYLFGGVDGDFNALDDLWHFDGAQWTRDTAAGASPPARYDGALGWDPRRERLVLFGGSADADLGDLWEWDGATWTQITATGGPGPRAPVTFSWDPARAALILTGGAGGGASWHDDAWAWDGAQWTALGGVVEPGVKLHHVAFDRGAGALVGVEPPAEGPLREWAWPLDDDTPPGLVGVFDWSAGDPGSATITKVVITGIAGGSAPASSGARLLAWDGWTGRWKSVDANAAAANGPGAIEGTLDGDDLSRFVHGDGTLAVQIRGAAGAPRGAASTLAVDVIELKVEYRY